MWILRSRSVGRSSRSDFRVDDAGRKKSPQHAETKGRRVVRAPDPRRGAGGSGSGSGIDDAPDDVVVLEFLEEGNLADRRRRDPFLLLVQPDTLERTHGVVPAISGLVHHTVRSLPDLLNLFEVVHRGRGFPRRVHGGDPGRWLGRGHRAKMPPAST